MKQPRPLSDLWDIAKACGQPRRTPRGVKFCCPIHDDKNPSCTAWLNEQGTRIQVRCFSLCDRDDIADELRHRGFVLRVRDLGRRKLEERQPKARDLSHEVFQRQKLARELWAQCVAIKGTVAEQYLWRRGLSLDRVSSSLHRTLRFHANCPRGKGRQPAMVAAYRHVTTDDLVAVHRVFLTRDGVKDGKPMMLGPCHEAAIKLTSHEATFSAPSKYCAELHVCEGIETGLAALMLGYQPLWVLGSAGMIANFEPLFGVGELVVCADHDKPGLLAAIGAVERWCGAGWTARQIAPSTPGQDWADVVKEVAQCPTAHHG